MSEKGTSPPEVDVSLDDAKPLPWLIEVLDEWKRLAFMAGYFWGAADSEDYDHDAVEMAKIRYAEWLKDHNGHEGTR